ncbi:RNA 2',3'-cyclic phosphodiesterase [Brevibacillus gelatini]
MRLFVALDIPEEAVHYISDVQARLKSEVRADRWQPLHNLHLTLHFLGEVDESLIPDICRDMDIVSAIIEPFQLRIGGFGAFPHAEHPRVLWLGLRGQTNALKQLHLLLGRRFELHQGGVVRSQALSPPHHTCPWAASTCGGAAAFRLERALFGRRRAALEGAACPSVPLGAFAGRSCAYDYPYEHVCERSQQKTSCT